MGTRSITIGVIGVVLYVVLALEAIRRFSQRNRSRAQMTVRHAFQLCTLAYAVMDIPQYAYALAVDGLAEYSVTKAARAAYGCHLVGMFLQLTALTMFIFLWARVFGNRTKEGCCGSMTPTCYTRGTATLFGVVDVTCAVLITILCIRLAVAPTTEQVGTALGDDHLYEGFVIAVSGCLLVSVAGLIACGARVVRELSTHHWQDHHVATIQSMVRWMNFAMVACSLAFVLRIVMLVWLAMDVRLQNNEIMSEFVWHLLSEWIPNGVSTIALLYLMRDPSASTPALLRSSGTGSHAPGYGAVARDDPQRGVQTSPYARV